MPEFLKDKKSTEFNHISLGNHDGMDPLESKTKTGLEIMNFRRVLLINPKYK